MARYLKTTRYRFGGSSRSDLSRTLKKKTEEESVATLNIMDPITQEQVCEMMAHLKDRLKLYRNKCLIQEELIVMYLKQIHEYERKVEDLQKEQGDLKGKFLLHVLQTGTPLSRGDDSA